MVLNGLQRQIELATEELKTLNIDINEQIKGLPIAKGTSEEVNELLMSFVLSVVVGCQ